MNLTLKHREIKVSIALDGKRGFKIRRNFSSTFFLGQRVPRPAGNMNNHNNIIILYKDQIN